jgi:hypothetical protein
MAIPWIFDHQYHWNSSYLKPGYEDSTLNYWEFEIESHHPLFYWDEVGFFFFTFRYLPVAGFAMLPLGISLLRLVLEFCWKGRWENFHLEELLIKFFHYSGLFHLRKGQCHFHGLQLVNLLLFTWIKTSIHLCFIFWRW